MFGSRFMPCPECGESVDREEPGPHVCDPDRLVAHHLFGLRSDVARLEESIAEYLESPSGQYEAWQARRVVRRGTA